ncbi:MAG: fibronectin type III domain-containing protein, partial [Elusimicrobia bacterium]|nr:fibronectin type III domain-containing protein [Elusimicrobiota bacterium]
GTVTSPISADDAFQGSGGGGGGANASVSGGAGAPGGAAIYIEAASMTVTGSILVDGSTASAVAFGAAGTSPGGGGGGGGGTIQLRVLNALSLSDGSILSAKGGGGGNVSSSFAGTKDPGGGGGGGRIKLFYRSAVVGTVTLSTAAGVAGGLGGFSGTVDVSTPPVAGAIGAVSFGVVASSPAAFAASSVYATSISWTWSAAPSFGDGPAASQLYRIFPSSAAAPLPAPQTTATSLAGGVTEQTLIPNTTYSRFVTAFTDWGDSVPSASVSTHTLAEAPMPGAAAFTGVAATALTLNWTGGANPSYTVYEVNAATSAGFSAPVSTSFAAAVSSSPASLAPNTTYYFRVRAVNLDGVPTAFLATQATATLAAAPASPAAGPVHITSGVFTWSGGANPPDTLYTAQVSSDNFFSLTDSSDTLATSATFFTLTPGTQYFLRVRAVNRNGVTSVFSTVISTTAGNLSNTTAPAAPGAPVADRAFSYDGKANFAWADATSPVGILDYNLIVGSLPGASDLFAGNVAVASYSASGMLTGRSYYAQVRARSNAGVYSVFSAVGAAVPVFIPEQNAPIAKPFSWPNPFDPARGEAQIGFYLEEAADVVLKIYTLQGRLIAKRSQSFAAGNQILTWNGNSESGTRVSPGGYVAVIEKRYGSRVSIQKLKIAVLY